MCRIIYANFRYFFSFYNHKKNLDNWKSSRRKRVEHIIDRVVETKKLELEEHDRTRRKSKTFTEMMEERQVLRTYHRAISELDSFYSITQNIYIDFPFFAELNVAVREDAPSWHPWQFITRMRQMISAIWA